MPKYRFFHQPSRENNVFKDFWPHEISGIFCKFWDYQLYLELTPPWKRFVKSISKIPVGKYL